ncbi:IS3 family transposase [Streptacidiphilus sp. PAMC 29251]
MTHPVEIAVAEYVDWFNQRRLHGELGHITPTEHEAAHYATEPPASLQKTS